MSSNACASCKYSRYIMYMLYYNYIIQYRSIYTCINGLSCNCEIVTYKA